MLRQSMLAAILGVASLAPSAIAADPAAVSIDKTRLEAFVRYTEGYTPIVKMVIDDPTPSEFKGLSRVVVHLTLGQQAIDKVYFVSADGQQFMNGSLWNLNESPWLDTLLHLPTNGPSYGPANAKITLVVFSDFQCPYCRSFAKTMREDLPKKYGNDVRVVFQDFPIAAIHKWAVAAAEASHCIGDGNPQTFWAFHDWIFEHQGEVNETNLREKTLDFAKTQKLDATKVSACLDSHASAGEVQASLKAGTGLGIQQTPTFFINGRMVSGAVPWNNLDAIVQLELNRPREIPGPDSVKSPSPVMVTPSVKTGTK
jgi:protein-disulfide isomerase